MLCGSQPMGLEVTFSFCPKQNWKLTLLAGLRCGVFGIKPGRELLVKGSPLLGV